LPAAEARLQQALRIDPGAADAWRALAEVAERAGDLEAAEACRMRVVELLPLDAVAHFALGNVLARRYAFEGARTAYLRATELAPGLAGAWGNLGNVHKYLGDFHAAIDCLRREFALEPDLAARARRHSNLLLSLHYDESLSAQVLLDAHVEWAECYARPWYPAQPVRPSAHRRRLRLGCRAA
jgi:tetratricopeptide (TPR) repeat protein